MYTGIKHLHSTLAYVLIAALVISFLYALFAALQKKSYNRKMALLGLITMHIQLVIGFIMYFVSPLGISNMGGAAMKDSIQRLYAVEHPLVMIIAVILVTVGYSQAKRMIDPVKANTRVAILYGIALILVLSRIPYHVWPAF